MSERGRGGWREERDRKRSGKRDKKPDVAPALRVDAIVDWHPHHVIAQEVPGRLQDLIEEHVDKKSFRLIYGEGEGILDAALKKELFRLKKQGKIKNFEFEVNTASCIVYLNE